MEEGKRKSTHHYMPEEAEFFRRLQARHRRGNIGRLFNYFSIAVAGLALIALFLNVANEAFGTIGLVNTIEPETLTDGRPLEALNNDELAMILAENVGGRLRVLIRNTISKVPVDEFTKVTVAEIVGDPNIDPDIAQQLLKDISQEQQAGLLAEYADSAALRTLVLEEVVEQQVIASFPLSDTIFNFEAIKAEIEGTDPGATQKVKALGRCPGHGDSLLQLVGWRILVDAHVEHAGAGWGTYSADRLGGFDGGGSAGGFAHRCWRGDLPGRIRAG